MGRNLMAQIAKYLTSYKRRQIGYWLLCSLGAVVVFCTTYALILPAITLSNEVICGMEAHVHDESCWTLEAVPPELICEEWKDADVVFHTHGELCYNSEGGLICSLEEREQHVHDESCYVEQRELICEETEAGEENLDAGAEESGNGAGFQPEVHFHTHSEECYSYERGELICGEEELEGHWHSDECYAEETTGAMILVCPLEESDIMGYDEAGIFHEQIHQHTDACYEPEIARMLTCGEEELEGHTHSDDCYEWEEVLTCGKTEGEPEYGEDVPEFIGETIPESGPEPVPEAHVHTDECYEITPVMVCGEEELELHTHGPECYETITVDDGMGGFEEQEILVCELPVVIEHQHTEDCLLLAEGGDREVMVRTCGLTVHVHDDSCYLDVGPDPDPYFCGLTEHIHSEECYFESGELRCTVPEHSHTDECLEPGSAPQPEYPTGIPEMILDEDGNPVLDADGNPILNDGTLFLDESGWPLMDPDGYPIVNDGTLFLDETGWPILDADGYPIVNDGSWVLDEDGYPALDENGYPIANEDGPNLDENGDPIPGGAESPDLDPVQVNDSFEVPADGFVMKFHIDGVALPVVDGEESTGGDSALDGGFPPLSVDVIHGSDGGYDSSAPDQDDGTEPEDSTPQAPEPPEEDAQPGAPEESGEENLAESGGEGGGQLLSMSLDSPSVPLSDLPLPLGEDEIGGSADNAEADTYFSDANDTNDPGEGGDLDSWETTPSAETYPADEDSEIEFQLVELTEGEDYQALMDQIAEATEGAELLGEPKVMQIVAYRNGQKLDLSNCEITLELKPTQELVDALAAQQAAPANKTGEEPDASEQSGEEPEQRNVSINFYTLDGEIQNKIMSEEEVMDYGAMLFSAEGDVCAYSAGFTPNPKFTVQFYVKAKFPLSNEGTLPFIDTSIEANGGTTARLPNNGEKDEAAGGPIKTKYLKLNGDGSVNFVERTEQLYLPETREFNPRLEDALNIDYLNSLRRNENYSLTAVWILKDPVNGDPASTVESDWTIITGDVETLNKTISFTNNDAAATDRKFLIDQSNKSTIRLVYEQKKSVMEPGAGADSLPNFVSPAKFYDYDISDGWKTIDGKQVMVSSQSNGINTPNNYSGSGAKFAFGNMNAGVEYGNESWNGNYLNRSNRYFASTAAGDVWHGYLGCTFGMVNGMQSNGDVQFVSTISAPNLFGDSGTAVTGRTPVDGHSLSFIHAGDTYTLSSVTGTKADNLEKFGHPGSYTAIWTNNFWPMDGVTNADFHFGATSMKGKQFTNGRHFAARQGTQLEGGVADWGTKSDNSLGLPVSDDGADHNSYFGMHFAVDFEVAKEYIGPLEYYFYGDDDLWVFLTHPDGRTELVCDIGGVHSSVGEYVNVWDYIAATEEGKSSRESHAPGSYRLNVYYTERGASGSTCWMQFTLPEVSVVEQDPSYEKEVAALRLKKEVKGAAASDLEKLEFRFRIDLDGVKNLYEMIYYNAEGQETKRETISGKDFTKNPEVTLKHGESVEIVGLPAGTGYMIEELFDEDNNYLTQIDNNGTQVGGILAKGTLDKVPVLDEEGKQVTDDKGNLVYKTKEVTVTYINTIIYSLPATGGPSTLMYTTGGTLLFTAAAYLLYRKRSGRRGAVDRT